MLVDRALAYLTGYVELEVRGAAPERFVNLCWARGVRLDDVRLQGERMRARVVWRDFAALRPIARRARVSVRIARRAGLPVLRWWLRRRAGVAVGAIALASLVVYLSGFVWFVEVRGARRVDAATIRAAAAAAGLRPGARRGSVRPEDVAGEIEARIPDVSQVLVALQGTRAVLTVVENAPAPDPPARAPRDLVARAAGLVERIVVVAGTAEVREGDVVRPGQVLIRGLMSVEDRSAPGTTAASWPVRAEGQVWARTWHERYEEVPLRYIDRVRTGRRYRRHVLRLGDRDIILWGRAPVPFAEWELELSPSAAFSWRNRHLPVEIQTATHHELTSVQRTRTASDALELARMRAAREVLPDLPAGSQLREVRAAIVQRYPDRVAVRSLVEVLQDIAAQGDVRAPGPQARRGSGG